MSVVPTLRPRWSVVLLTAITVGLIAGTPGHLLTHAWFDPLLYGCGLAATTMYTFRWRTLTPTDEGLWIYRSHFNQMFSCWGEIVRVERRRIGPSATDQLVLREPVRKTVKSDGRSPAEIVWKPRPNQRVLIGLYDKRWRTGPIGAALRERGVSLEAIEPPGPTQTAAD